MQDIGRRLRFYRREKNLSIYDAEKMSGIKFGLVAAYERGDKRVSIERIKKLAKAYEVPAIYIIFSEKEIAETLHLDLCRNAELLLEKPVLNELLSIVKDFSDETIISLLNFIKKFIRVREESEN